MIYRSGFLNFLLVPSKFQKDNFHPLFWAVAVHYCKYIYLNKRSIIMSESYFSFKQSCFVIFQKWCPVEHQIVPFDLSVIFTSYPGSIGPGCENSAETSKFYLRCRNIRVNYFGEKKKLSFLQFLALYLLYFSMTKYRGPTKILKAL